MKLKRPNWIWLEEPKHLLENPNLAHFLQPFAQIIEEAESDFEKQVLAWSIIHYTTLTQLNAAQIHLVFYEDLCANFEQEMRRLLAYLGDHTADHALDERLLRQSRTPSHTAQAFSAILTNSDLLDVWHHQLTAEQLGMGDYILNAFGLGQIYHSGRLTPDQKAAAFLLKASSRANSIG